jgi:hypothetical protein
MEAECPSETTVKLLKGQGVKHCIPLSASLLQSLGALKLDKAAFRPKKPMQQTKGQCPPEPRRG